MSSVTSVSSLSAYSVPLTDLGYSTSASGLIFPRLKYRFRVLFTGFGTSTSSIALTKQIMDCTKPTAQFDQKTIDVYNSVIKYPGKPTWSDVTITIRDSMDGAVQELVGEQMQQQFDFANQASATAPGAFKFVTEIEELDGGNTAGTGEDPTVLTTFTLGGCWIKSAAYDSLDYKNSGDPVTIKLTVCYDNALQDTGIGDTITRASSTSSI